MRAAVCKALARSEVKLLVTGAMGHVGLALVAHTARQGHDVIALYRNDFRENDATRAGPSVRWLKCDLKDKAAIEAIAQEYKVDACIHCAAVSNEAYAKPNPLEAIESNVGATANLLDAARRHGWRRFLFVSTGSVFQNRADVTSPIGEDEPPQPGNVYGTTKAAAEKLVGMYRSIYGLSASTVRISWVFGPPVLTDSPARGPIPSFLMRAARGEAIREGGGDFRASFTWIGDVAEGLLRAAAAPELRHAVYHLAPGRDFTAQDVAAAVKQAFPHAVIELGPGTDPWTKYTALRGPLSAQRLAEDTGFARHTPLESAIGEYAGWVRGRSAPDPD